MGSTRAGFLQWAGLAVAAFGLAGAAVVFAEVQVLESYPFHIGVFGDQQALLGLTYTDALEALGFLASLGIFARSYSMTEGTRRARSTRAAGTVLLVVGSIVAITVYVETTLLWGEILPGVKVWQGLPGGGGYPWWSEQVAYNTCFVGSTSGGDCLFLNYAELFWLSFFSVILGYVWRNR